MKALKRVLKYLKGNMLLTVLSLILALISSLTALEIPIIIGQVIDLITGLGDPINGNVLTFRAVTLWDVLGPWLITAGIMCLISAVSVLLMNIINNKITYNVVEKLRNSMFEKIQKMPLSYLDSHSTGEIVSRMINDTEQLGDGLLLGFTNFFTGLVTIVGTMILMLKLNFVVALCVIVLTPLSFFVAKFISGRTYNMFKLQNETKATQTAYIDEYIGNEKVVKSFGYEDEALENFDVINDSLRDCSLKAVFFSSLTNPCTRFVNAVIYAVVALVGGYMALAAKLTIGTLSTLLCYANQYTKPFNEITGVITELQNAISCANRIFDFLDQKEEENSKVLDETVYDDDSSQQEISIENVSFSYNPQVPLIEDFNLKVKAGQSVAIVGPTGCGKTTFINLLMRFYEVNKGSISIGSTKINDMRRHELRGKFGMVLQDTWIKDGTVLDNILLGDSKATREEAIEAAKAVHAHDFIKRLPNGYDTLLNGNGGELSAGQKQLLCIARVMLMQPSMLILDEATSNIDTRTEILISNAFDKLMKGRTSFVVAHRLSTIVNADVILVMKDGHIIEQGNHSELMAKNGFYRQLFMSQYGNAS